MAKSLYFGKGSLLSRGEMISELMAWWAFSQRDAERHEANKRWYWTARGECLVLATKYGISLHMAIQVVACISPGKKWTINLRDAEYVLQAWQKYTTEEDRLAYLGTLSYQTGYTWENTRNAFECLDTGSSIPEERMKTFCFGQNLEFPGAGKRATIDLHMAHILGKTRKKGSVNVTTVYPILEAVVIDTAHILNVLPEELQGATWGARVDAFEAGLNVDSLCDLVESMLEAELYV